MAFVVMMLAELHNGRRACLLAMENSSDEEMTAYHLALTHLVSRYRVETTLVSLISSIDTNAHHEQIAN
jgi:hypothetical protein